MIQVPFHLRRLPHAAPADAFLLCTQNVEELLRFCVRLNVDPLPRIYATTDGFLLLLAKPTSAAFPPAIRLQQRVANLLLPADAELVPSLLDDEAKGLVHDRGLVFLPGGRVLAYLPDQPLPLSQLLTVERTERRQWRSLPEVKTSADRLHEIFLDLPPIGADDLLLEGAEGIGTEDPLPGDESLPTQMLGKAAMTAGKGLMALSQVPGFGMFGKMGANLVSKALSMVPALGASLLGAQEAALRALLREFREGNLERALRRALPMGEPGQRGVAPAAGARLPFHNLFYSLSNILGGGSRGPASVWFGGYDVQRELSDEYRKAAEQATRRGDFRRAAFIYGKLLRDYRMAAHVLAQGGLHRDAALLYHDKVGDLLAAAREFEGAGETDRALQIYRQLGELVRAGDLLRRLGEEEEAVAEYVCAADKLARTGEHLAAGELILNKTDRADLAATYWSAGWSLRERRDANQFNPTTYYAVAGVPTHLTVNAVPCAVRLARLYTNEKQSSDLLRLTAEAEAYFRHPGDETDAGTFFNELAVLAEQPHLHEVRADLRDSALMILTSKLRQRAPVEKRPGTVVSDLLGRCPAWGAPLVSDAGFAFKNALQPQKTPIIEEKQKAIQRLRIHDGIVTAAVQAPASGDLYLGFADGSVFCFRPAKGEIVRLPFYHLPVASLATDADGGFVAVLRHEPPAGYFATYQRGSWEGAYTPREGRTFVEETMTSLAPLAYRPALSDDTLVVLMNASELQFLAGGRAIPIRTTPAVGQFALTVPQLGAQRSLVLHLDGSTLQVFPGWTGRENLDDNQPSTAPLSRGLALWSFGPAAGNPLRVPQIAWLSSGIGIELTGVDEDGVLHWATLAWRDAEMAILDRQSSNPGEKYLAATLLRPSWLAGVTPTRIYWIRAGRKGLTWQSATRVDLPAAATCFASMQTQELIVVCSDGTVTRAPIPQ